MGDRSTYIHIHSTAPYSAARETTTSVGLAHARPIIIELGVCVCLGWGGGGGGGGGGY